MAAPTKAEPLDFFFGHQYRSVSRPRVYLDAIESLRISLLAKLIAHHDAYFVKVEDTVTQTKEGQLYRAAYVDSIHVTGFSETKHRPTLAKRTQYDAIWMRVEYTEYAESLDGEGTLGGEGGTRGTPIAEQIQQLEAAVAEHAAAGVHVIDTLPTDQHAGHPYLYFAIWPDTETLTLSERERFRDQIRGEFKLCQENRCLDRK
ncbi:hypothetical protein O9K51_04532 [Purpureocillium lavendulum]|uniref:Uncharacterized protein n=1 Tax=Purpureocillium lavendulum TaxID=1247861 RepID=A0AB34FV58_9HYPO|nr:hypothetical protein O9K51_04532 [Purpureocillium lavendulum]